MSWLSDEECDYCDTKFGPYRGAFFHEFTGADGKKYGLLFCSSQCHANWLARNRELRGLTPRSFETMDDPRGRP